MNDFAHSYQSSFRLQASKFNGVLFFGISKFFLPKDTEIWLPTRRCCWMKEAAWASLIKIVDNIPTELKSKGFSCGMHHVIWLSVL